MQGVPEGEGGRQVGLSLGGASPIKIFCGHLHVLNILRALHIITLEPHGLLCLWGHSSLSLPRGVGRGDGAQSISKIVSTWAELFMLDGSSSRITIKSNYLANTPLAPARCMGHKARVESFSAKCHLVKHFDT